MFIRMLALSVLALPCFAIADWSVDSEQSSVNFISTKKNHISEVHSFKHVSGTVSDSGVINVEIDLASVETNIDIRNERMAEFLFETSKFAKATLTGNVKADKLNAMKAGQMSLVDVELVLSLHGQEQKVATQLRVAKLADNNLFVSTVAPVVINANDFALVAGVDKLKELAGLPVISYAVPVTASFVMSKK